MGMTYSLANERPASPHGVWAMRNPFVSSSMGPSFFRRDVSVAREVNVFSRP